LTERASAFALNQGYFSAQHLGIPNFDDAVGLSFYEDGIPMQEYERFKYIRKQSFTLPASRSPLAFMITGAVAEDYPSMPFKGMNIFDDDPMFFKLGSRANHHFHDPEKSPVPGLDNRSWTVTDWFIRDKVMKNLGDLRGVSAANRALDSAYPPFAGEAYRTAVPANLFDWADARRYYL
jgi:hypothetical protein